MSKKITGMYFSPTETTKKVVSGIAQRMVKSGAREEKATFVDFTLPEGRKAPVSFSKEDVVIIGVPVYAGRVPNILLPYLHSIVGHDATAIAVVVYGNRNYDDALIELKDILTANGFHVLAGGAFIGEHSFSTTLAQHRPDAKDMASAREFAEQIHQKMGSQEQVATLTVKGNQPYGRYYRPKNKHGDPVDIRKVAPKTHPNCVGCRLCVAVCPMGSIDLEDVAKLTGICIKCGACIKKCPVQAKYYDDADYLRHKDELEIDFAQRKEPEWFV